MDVVDEVMLSLTQSVSVEMVGRPTSGRTHLLEVIVERLRADGYHLVFVPGISTLSGIPMSCFALAFPEVSRQPSISEATLHLTGLLSKKKSILVVDDADDLDTVSSGVIGAVRARTKAPALLVRRLGSHSKRIMRALASSTRPGVRVTVPPLTFNELQIMLSDILAGPVDAKTMARIISKSGGLPGLAKGMTIVGMATGTMFRSGDHWTSTSALWSPELTQVVEAMLFDASEVDYEALTLLTFANSLTVSEARRILSDEVVERLAALGFITCILGEDEGTVALYPPLLAEYLVATSTVPQRERIKETLAAHGIVMPSTLLAELMQSPEDPSMLIRSVESYWHNEAQSRLCTWQAEPTPARAIPLMIALLVSDEQFIINPTDVYLGTDLDQGTVEECAELIVWYGTYLAVMIGDRPAAHSLLEVSAKQYPEAEGYINALHTHVHLLMDHVPPLPSEPKPTELTVSTDGFFTIKAEISAARGHFGEAQGALDAIAQAGASMQTYTTSVRLLSQIMLGDFLGGAQAAEAALQRAIEARQPGAIHAFAYLTVLAYTCAGSIGDAERVMSEVLLMTSVASMMAYFYSGLLGLSTWVSRLTQGAYGAWSSPRIEALPAPYHSGPFPYMTASSRQVLDLSPEEAWSRVEDLAERGYLSAFALYALDVAEAFPGKEHVKVLRKYLGKSDSKFVNTVIDLTVAVCSRNAEEIVAAQDTFSAMGAYLFVARAGIQG
ncbi:MAG: hypothetical protein FWG11_08825, partial [Promicromonosporaceae bacterium]|nr:hypothetical protein [Promicromonosporaceae bacterium]